MYQQGVTVINKDLEDLDDPGNCAGNPDGGSIWMRGCLGK